MTDEDYGDVMEPIREAADDIKEQEQKPKPKTKKKSAKEIFAETVDGFAPVETKEPIRGIKENDPIVDDDGILDLKLELPPVTKEELGLTSSVEDESSTDETEGRPVYKASAVEKVPAPVRTGMQVFGVGKRRRLKQKEEKKSPRINQNTFKAFPDKELGSVNKTTFKG